MKAFFKKDCLAPVWLPIESSREPRRLLIHNLAQRRRGAPRVVTVAKIYGGDRIRANGEGFYRRLAKDGFAVVEAVRIAVASVARRNSVCAHV